MLVNIIDSIQLWVTNYVMTHISPSLNIGFVHNTRSFDVMKGG